MNKRQTRTAWIWLVSPYKTDPYEDNKARECVRTDSDGIDCDGGNDEKRPSTATGRCHQPAVLELGTWQAMVNVY